MQVSRLSAGIRIGTITAAATAGALIGLGLRHQSAWSPFETVGRATLATLFGVGWASPISAAVTGLLVHAAWMILWGVCFATVALHFRSIRLFLAAAILVSLVFLLAKLALPSALGAVSRASLSTPQMVLLLILMALSLVAGMALVRPSSRFARHDATR